MEGKTSMDAVERLARIGEIAERLGVSPRTIKYYEELGLMEPEGRTPGGFRLYGEGDVRRLERILRLKGMGFSLSAIGELLAVRDSAREATKNAVLEETIGRLTEREREVSERIGRMREDLKRAEAVRRELRRDIELCRERAEKLAK